MAQWQIEYYRDPGTGVCPALRFLEGIPDEVEAELLATLAAVEGHHPPYSFRGGLRWQAMRDEMTGFFEIRDEHDKLLYRLFCRLDRQAPGLPHSAIVVIDGDAKPDGTAMPDAVYERIRTHWAIYEMSNPRSVCESA